MLKVITRSHGKLTLFAPHARKSRKRFGSTIDVLDWGVFQTARGKGPLPIMQSFTPRSSFPHLRSSFEKLALATFVCEVFDLLLPEDAVEKDEVFEGFQLCLRALDEAGDLKTALRSCYLALSGLLVASGLIRQAEQPSANALMRLAARVEEYAQRPLQTREQLKMVLDALRAGAPE